MALRPQLTGLALCAGVGMLEEGVAAGLDLLGFDYRTVCYVERDIYAAAALVARMESAAMAPALIWDDIATFDGRMLRGCVDLIAAGFPCQDLSVAGRRAGLDGARSGLFFRILDIADACGARWLFLENVAGITAATAAIVDPAEGELLERAAARVVGELADRWWSAEWLHLRASDVGAAHQRERWFCFAWRMGDTGHGAARSRGTGTGRREQTSGFAARSDAVADPSRVRSGERIGQRQREASAAGLESRPQGCGEAMADTGLQHEQPLKRRDGAEHPAGSAAMDFPARERRGQGRTEHARHEGRRGVTEHGGPVANAIGARPQGQRPQEQIRRHQPESLRRDAGKAGALFATGPADARWSDILTARPELAPAVEPGVCRVVDGLAYRVDQHRADRLRCIGNGVVAAQAAAAFIELVRRAGKW